MADRPPQLRDAIDDFARQPLDAIIARARRLATVEQGRPATDDEIDRLARYLKTSFAPGCRAFMATFGWLRLVGDDRYGFGQIEVFGPGTMELARVRFRNTCEAFMTAHAGWRDRAIPEDPERVERMRALFASMDGLSEHGSRPTPVERPFKLRDALQLEAHHLEPWFDDIYNPRRIAYRHMAPVIRFDDTTEQGIDCVGPTGLVYCVDLKSCEIEPPTTSFEDRLKARLGGLVVRPQR